LPHVDSYLIDVWHELGRALSGGYGLVPLTFTEIKAYSDSVYELNSFDCSMLSRMSREYVSEQAAASQDANRPAPHEGKANIEAIRSNVAKSLKAMFNRLAESP
jgi:hypothetical protein